MIPGRAVGAEYGRHREEILRRLWLRRHGEKAAMVGDVAGQDSRPSVGHRAKWGLEWAIRRACLNPGVMFTAEVDDHRLGLLSEDGRTARLVWRV